MKTSNYILSAFLIFIFGGIFFLFIGANYLNGTMKTKWITQKNALEPFSVVVAEPGTSFILKNGPQNKIIQNYTKATVTNVARFAVRNDTLFVYAVKQQANNKEQAIKGGFTVVTGVFCKNLKSIITKENAIVRLDDLELDSLSVHSKKAQVSAVFKNIKTVFIQAEDSDIYFSGGNIDNLDVKLDKTKLRVAAKKRTLRLSASLKNNTQAYFTISNRIDLDVDPTSNYGFVNTIN
jgi:hypothetical protein